MRRSRKRGNQRKRRQHKQNARAVLSTGEAPAHANDGDKTTKDGGGRRATVTADGIVWGRR